MSLMIAISMDYHKDPDGDIMYYYLCVILALALLLYPSTYFIIIDLRVIIGLLESIAIHFKHPYAKY
jgi:hypothetical protein